MGEKYDLAAIRLVASSSTVYEPSDDSYALVDCIASFLQNSNFAPSLCIEIGTGSGYAICSAALLLKQRGVCSQCLGVDLNPAACLCTQETLNNHQVGNVDCICCDLLSPLSQRLRGKVDLLIFNPPYVATPDEETRLPGIARAWAGGMRGRVVIDKITPLVPDLLSEGGHFFLVTVSENDPHGSIALKRQADEETLTVLHFQKQKQSKLL